MKRLSVGFDTSCYTTSVACVSEEGIVFQKRTMLSVALGKRGLRQSEAVFQHVRNLPPLVNSLFAAVSGADVATVAVSVRPVDAADSYMPVFLAGKSTASAVSGALSVPLVETVHQAGHVRAALFGNEQLMREPRILALHLSGGTTDVLSVGMEDGALGKIEALGGSDDLHAGQLVDRIGVKLGLPFPSGPSLERLAVAAADTSVRIPSSVRGLTCSLSGAESQAVRLLDGGADGGAVAFAVYDCISRTVHKLVENAMEAYGDCPVLLSGGVAGSALLRRLLSGRSRRRIFYAADGLSADNAVGAALIGLDWKSRHV